MDRIAAQPEAAALLHALLEGILGVFGDRLAGFYVYGSLVRGGFDPDISDLDTMASIKDDVTGRDVEALRRMHAELVRPDRVPSLERWNDRIEVQYVPMQRLPGFREAPFPMANISPGEPIHLIEADRDWLVNWYFVQTYGIALYGLPPEEGARTAPMLTPAEFRGAVREYALSWREHIAAARDSRGYQAYAVLTMCRALYTLVRGDEVSKPDAAEWTAAFLPEHAGLIRDALAWRRYTGPSPDPAPSRPRVEAFVLEMADRIEALP
ncbi:MAG: DUF4111 domain-containing protein [Clostridia bacterium]|nr:DUF4111 domain-containing protein [Clostridia bacterium]